MTAPPRRAAAPGPFAGSWPVIVVLGAAFLVTFAWQRHRSTFLAIERERPVALELAARHGVSASDALAVRDLIGIEQAVDRWEDAIATFAKRRAELGEPLAAIAIAGDGVVAEAVRAGAADAESAWLAFRTDPRAVPGLRFLVLRDRFAARAAGSRD